MSACLRAKLLGGFSVYWGNVPLVEPGSRINKNVELLALLLVGDKQPLDNQQLMEALWEGEAANPAGALKNAVYSLRRLLEQAAPGVSFIRTAGQHYQLEPGLAVELDTAEFSRQAEAALADGLPDAEKLAACRRALELYTGEFAPALSSRPWARQYGLQLQQLYFAVAEQAAGLLLDTGSIDDARQAYDICGRALLLQPRQEGLYAPLFASMQRLEMKSAVRSCYPVVLELFYNQLERPLPRQVRAAWRWACDGMPTCQEDLARIRKDFAVIRQQEQPAVGPYLCDYQNFRSLYPLLSRAARRSGGSLAVGLITLSLHGEVSDRKQLDAGMQWLVQGIRSTLRREDVVCRYGRRQYAVMMILAEYEDVSTVEQRLRENLALLPGGGEHGFVLETAFFPPDPVC